jgi:hypothetical protein
MTGWLLVMEGGGGEERGYLNVAFDAVVGVHWGGFDCVAVAGEIVAFFSCDIGITVEGDGEAEETRGGFC